MGSKVTTKRGDGGETTSISGEVYAKSHPVMECCGAVDRLRAHTALCRLQIIESGHDDAEDLSAFLFWLLQVYFLIGAQCNDPLNKKPDRRRADLAPEHLDKLEAEQARIEGQIEFPARFIVSASNAVAAQLDIACTVSRDLERKVVRLTHYVPGFEAVHILPFVNRLSDYLYILARFLEDGNHQCVDYDAL